MRYSLIVVRYNLNSPIHFTNSLPLLKTQIPQMKKILSILFVATIICSCANNNGATDTIKKDFNTNYSGVWVLSNYLQAIQQGKSPLAAAKLLEGEVALVIDSVNSSDSVQVRVNLNNHEGYPIMAYLKPGITANSVKTNNPDYDHAENFYELSSPQSNDQARLYLNHYNAKNELIDKKEYVKIANSQPTEDLSWAIQQVVNQHILVGNYVLLDAANKAVKVSFKIDGQVSGLDQYKSYALTTDFLGGPEATFDQIYLSLNEKTHSLYGFKIKGDTTLLYQVKGDAENGDPLELDKVKYRLIKQKG